MNNLEVFIAGMIAALMSSIGIVFYSLGYNETKSKKTIEIDTDLGEIKKYE